MYKLALLIALLFIAPAAAISAPNRTVLGYSATWRDANTPPDSYNYNATTLIARAFLAPHPDGSIGMPDGYFNESLLTLAHQHGVKLLLSIGGEAENADNWLSIAKNPEYIQRFEQTLADLLRQHHYDGIDIDWEPAPLTTEDGAAYIALLKGLRARFPDRIITTALPASDYWTSHFAWKDVTDNVDFVNVMTYDYSGGWGGKAAYCSNLFPAGAYPPDPELSASEGMQNLIVNHKVPPAKLLMGMTFWPSRFAVDKVGDRFPINAPGYSMNITYGQAMDLLASGKYADFWDEKAAMPYMQRQAGGSVICYESPQSIGRKCEYAAKLGCGLMIWHLGADVHGNSAALMDAVAKSVGAAKQTFPESQLELEISDLKGDLKQLKSPAGDSSSASDEQMLARLQRQWAVAQDQAWVREAPKHKGN